MNRRAFMGGFIGATMAPVLPVAVNKAFFDPFTQCFRIGDNFTPLSEIVGREPIGLSFTLHHDD